jgi:uncharacterized membrane protein
MPVPASRFASFRNTFFSGLLLLAPLGITVWAFLRVIDVVGGAFSPRIAMLAAHFLPVSWQDSVLLNVVWNILSTVIVVLLIALLGWISHYVAGRVLLQMGDRFIQRIPGISAVYNTVNQIIATFGPHGRSSFSQVVLVEFPRAGSWTIGFLTNKQPGEPQARVAGELWAVFVPTTPNPTGGYMLLVPRAGIIELDMSVAEGMKMIISGGAIAPPWPAAKKPAAPPA